MTRHAAITRSEVACTNRRPVAALKSLGADRGQPVIHHVAVLALFGVISLLVATVAYRRDDGRTYG